ncbi:IS200/IS605 family transposase [cf. Phormidesmis sp. LEGE 11477]|uniref:IS200/IS605 family transposase n=1 Tax=cf. Phormidesmis sp. LEGE 11477 TaxID=1828680 RepID=UPI0018800EBE|nr:IS200/IS605 family transposase [cf. Phormidesmis sp. LEGE 11477]MBE9064462.1 IS200/IS605 family transposase [cf. Phormidesmis sp. LEGE 11477]
MAIAYRKGSHSVFSIVLHTYFVTAYRRKCLLPEMINRIEEIAGRVLVKSNCILLECDGEADHVHLAIDLHPSVAPSTLVGSMKSASSRIIRKEFETELRPYFRNWSKGLWGDQKYYASAGGAPIATLIEYIQDHNRGSGHTQKPSKRKIVP